MDTMMDIERWMAKLTTDLKAAFGDRLMIVGLQGSQARGESRPDSDIDVVVIIDEISTSDLEQYKNIISSMPANDMACGFIGSAEVLAAWPRYDAFNLVKDTQVVYGSFDFMDTDFTAIDAMNAAKATASEIYHALAHTIAFESENLQPVLDACIKPTFFVMRALQFASTGIYPASRAEMRTLATDEEALFLDAYDGIARVDTNELARRLFDWVGSIIARSSADQSV